jgi:hypothetical protein
MFQLISLLGDFLFFLFSIFKIDVFKLFCMYLIFEYIILFHP